MRLALLGLAVAVLGLLAVAPVAPEPVDLLLLEAQLDVILELIVLGVAALGAVEFLSQLPSAHGYMYLQLYVVHTCSMPELLS